MVTNPDRPAGRGMQARGSPVKLRALGAGIEVLQPERLADEPFVRRLEELAPDVGAVVAYGRILPAGLLAIPRLGFVNVHFSLLPSYRGAAPVQRAIMDGATTTGVTIIVLTQGMDEGPVLATEKVDIELGETAGTLGARLADIGAGLLVDTLDAYEAGTIVPQPQDHRRATYAPKIAPDEARIEWARPGREVVSLVRALSPHPGAWTTFRSARVKILEVGAGAPDERFLAPGHLARGSEALVGVADGTLVLRVVKPAGKRARSGAEWLRGARPQPHERME